MATLTKKQTTTTSSVTIRFMLGIVLSAVSGAMLLLSFPPYGIWPLIFVSLVPFLYAQHRLFPRQWSSLGPAIALLVWLTPYLMRIFGAEAPFFFRYMGVWIALLNFFAARERRFHELTHYRWFILQGVFSWVGFEMIRYFIPLLATNGFVGNTLASQAWLIQPVSVFSIYGMNLIIMLVNLGVAQGVLAWSDRRQPFADVVPVSGGATLRWVGGVAAVVAAWVGLSLLMLSQADQDAPTVRVAALQPNFPHAAHIDAETPSQVRLDTFVRQAQEAAAQGAEVIVSTEMNFAFDPQMEYTAELKELAAETGAYLVLAYVVSNEEEFRNEAVVLTPSGEFLDVYGKNHVFGEPPTPSAGVYPVYETPMGNLAVLICHDANYTDVARRLTRNGAQFIAAPTLEFGGVGEQLWTNDVFRAVENRVPIVMVGGARNSAVIDAYGRLLALEISETGEQLTIVRDLPLGEGNAPLVSLGDWLGWVCLAGLVFFMVFQSVTERRAKSSVQA